MAYITAISTAVPDNIVTNEQAKEFARYLFANEFRDIDRLLSIFDHSTIQKRHFCMPLEWFRYPHSFQEKNEAYCQAAVALSVQAASAVLKKAQVKPGSIDVIIFVSSTGISTPSLDVRIAQAIGLCETVKRVPLWGLGCAGGASGLARAYDYLTAHPTHTVLVIAVELCGLTFIQGDRSKSNLVGSALFADGAAAVLVQGALVEDTRNKIPYGTPRIVGTKSQLWPHSEDVMGWDVCDDGLAVIFSRDIPSLVRKEIGPQVRQLLDDFTVSRAEMTHFIAHPGGAKVLDAYQDSLQLADHALDEARLILTQYGNMSSPTVLFVLEKVLASLQHRCDKMEDLPVHYGVLAALGPGFSCEQVLLSFS